MIRCFHGVSYESYSWDGLQSPRSRLSTKIGRSVEIDVLVVHYKILSFVDAFDHLYSNNLLNVL